MRKNCSSILRAPLLWLLFNTMLLLAIPTHAQHIVDPYQDLTGQPVDPNAIRRIDSHEGEFQYLMYWNGSNTPYAPEDHWFTDNNGDTYFDESTYARSYELELVSFPFVPDLEASTSTTSVFKVADDAFYNGTHTYWDLNDIYQNSKVLDAKYSKPYFLLPTNAHMGAHRLFRKFSEEANEYQLISPTGKVSGVGPGTGEVFAINGRTSLVSQLLVGATPDNARIVLPHSAIRMRLKVHCGADINSSVADQRDFVLDLTRGEMRRYPFTQTNFSGSDDWEHDVTMFLNSEAGTNYTSTFNARNTFDYFPNAPLPINPCNINYWYPTNLSASYKHGDFLKLPPYSIDGLEVYDDEGLVPIGYWIPNGSTTYQQEGSLTSIHKYIIDKPINLTYINFDEKVIYNPSEVDIDIKDLSTPLVFPTGYKFKTVLGTYPSKAEVEAVDPKDGTAPRDITVPNSPATGNHYSHYYVKSGSHLLIESCVEIWDATIHVEAGAQLSYGPSSVLGNVVFDIQPGATVSLLTTGSAYPSGCSGPGLYDLNGIVSHEVTGNDTWSTTSLPNGATNPLHIEGNLVIKTNATLDIDPGVIVEFGPEGRIIVEEGATLRANGVNGNEVIFRSACNSMWKGIKVEGDPAVGQGSVSTTTQGIVMLEHTEIEDAECGVLVGAPAGGVLQAKYTNFRNCLTGVEMDAYQNILNGTNLELNNTSYIHNSTFLTDGPLKTRPVNNCSGSSDNSFIRHLVLLGIKNLDIKSNTFKNTGIINYNPWERGIGIYAIESSFRLPTSYGNTFSSLTEGIHVVNTGTQFVSVEGCEFIGNIYGVIIEGSEFTQVTGCDFEASYPPQHNYAAGDPNTRYNKSVGLFLNGCTDFHVEENTFTYTLSSVPDTDNDCEDCNYGIVCRNTSDQNDRGHGLITRNEFSNTTIGIQLEGNNKGKSNLSTKPLDQNGSGVVVDCNDFHDLVFSGVAVVGHNGTVGKWRQQGATCSSGNKHATNTFSGIVDPSTTLLERDIFTDQMVQAPIPYYYPNISFEPEVAPNSAVSLNFCSLGSYPTTLSAVCPSTLYGTCDVPCLRSQIGNYTSALNNAINSFNAKLDGGDTPGLLGIVETGSQNTVLAKLNQNAPFLSDEVLIAAVNRTPNLPDQDLSNILMAHAGLSTSVMNAIIQRVPALPISLIEALEMEANTISERTESLLEIDELRWQKNQMQGRLVRHELVDENLDKGIVELEAETFLNSKKRLLPLYLGKRDFGKAENTLNDIISLEGNTSYSDLYQVLYDLGVNGRSAEKMTAYEWATVSTIASSTDPIAAKAQALLRLNGVDAFYLNPWPVNTGAATTSPAHPMEIQDVAFSNPSTSVILEAHPNPFQGQTLVKTTIPEDLGTGTLHIFNSLGQPVAEVDIEPGTQQFSLGDQINLQGGIYICLLKVSGKVEANIRLVHLQ